MMSYIHKFSGVLLFFGSLLSITVLTAQNVGINTTTPTQALDVNGNIAISGAIVPNGQNGTEGQVLQMQSGGTLKWVDMTKYQNVRSFFIAGTITQFSWTVPAGVTEVLAEIWGGGGAGSTAGGGGSGGYVITKIAVSPGDILTIDIGLGAQPSNSFSATFSKIAIGANYVRANAGINATSSTVGIGGAGGYANNIAAFQYKKYFGEDGHPRQVHYEQASSTLFYTVYNYGDGGNSLFVPPTGGRGRVETKNSANGVVPGTYAYSTAGKDPGGGGGGNTGGFTRGGNGMVILYW